MEKVSAQTEEKIAKKIQMPLKAEERLKLDDMIRNNPDYVDTTENIRKVKHSKQLITSVGIIEQLKLHYADIRRNDPTQFNELCRNKCSFLYNNYMDIFNKLVNDELDLQILSKFLQVLRAIEDAQIDQNEGSVIIGQLLKELYVDSALKRGAKLDSLNANNNDDDVVGKKMEIVNRGVSWAQYKHNNNFIKKPATHTL
jgi:hypothetical protein